jgi:hypothetical protein
VPADDKKIRDYLIARTLVERLETLELKWPKADAEVIARKVD